MKIYNKPELEIVEFDIDDVITSSTIDDDPTLDLQSDEVFYGAEEGYLINN